MRTESPSPAEPQPLLRPGDTCWRVACADRLAVIVDASDYFATVRAAVQNARHSVILIGWDFDTRIELERPATASNVPNRLGKFLTWCIEQRPELRIYVLRWDLGLINSLGRGSTPLVVLDWMTSRRIRFKLDGAHPVGSAHHQKIVVIDDALAFCGGIDITGDRWDTREHLDDNPERVRPTTKRPYGPWHDVSTAVDGEAARALGELARRRWKNATGEDIEPPPPARAVWPEGLQTSFRDVDVAIARTAPGHGDEKAVFEIERLYLAAIRGARRTIYVESQYFASRKIAEAMAARLREPDGPEIIVVNPETANGWLEEEVMGSSRARLLRLVAEADTHGRFRIYTPVTDLGRPIYVHAKVMVVDDRLLKVGSSNLNNRSLGFDTECDLAIEANASSEGARRAAAIVTFRNELLAEHLGVDSDIVARTIQRSGGSLIRAVEDLRRSRGRTLVPFEAPELALVEDALLSENQLLDPERPSRFWKNLRRTWRRLLPLPWAGGGRIQDSTR